MTKSEFEEDDDGLPDTLGDLDFDEEEKTDAKPVVNSSSKKESPKKKAEKPIETEKAEEKEAEPEITFEQQWQSVIQSIVNLEDRMTNLEATVLRLIQALKSI